MFYDFFNGFFLRQEKDIYLVVIKTGEYLENADRIRSQ